MERRTRTPRRSEEHARRQMDLREQMLGRAQAALAGDDQARFEALGRICADLCQLTTHNREFLVSLEEELRQVIPGRRHLALGQSALTT